MPFGISNSDIVDLIDADSISRLFDQVQASDIEDPHARDIWLGAFRALRELREYAAEHFTDDVGVGLAVTVDELKEL